jgi:cyclase
MQHFVDVFQQAHADAALAAGIFHFKEMTIPDLKHYLKSENINVRL